MGYLNNLKDEFNYYIKHKDSFVEKYNGKFVSIKNHSVICEANTREEAITHTIKIGHAIGTFLVQYVSRSNDESIQRFHSRVYC